MRPASPTGPALLAVPPNAEVWRSRFVLSAKQNQPTLTLLGSSHEQAIHRLIEGTCSALDSKTAPTLVDDGLGGTYFIKRADGTCVSVFKPCDEEPCAINNPKRERQEFAAQQGAGGMFGIRIGQGALNECAAWLIDSSERARGFSRVPPTARVCTEHSAFFSASEATHSQFRMIKAKVGSLQRFEASIGCAEDYGPSAFSTLAVQRVALLDIRLFNLDRHGGNMLAQRGAAAAPRLRALYRDFEPDEPDVSGVPGAGTGTGAGTGAGTGTGAEEGLQLIPIDHGFCLPERPTLASFEWRGWPQARAPLEPAACDYLARLDGAADARLLRRAGLREACVRTMRIGTLLLQRSVLHGLSLAEIAEIMCEPTAEIAAEIVAGKLGGRVEGEQSPLSVVVAAGCFDSQAGGQRSGGGGGEGGGEGGGAPGGEESLLQWLCEAAEGQAAEAAAAEAAATASLVGWVVGKPPPREGAEEYEHARFVEPTDAMEVEGATNVLGAGDAPMAPLDEHFFSALTRLIDAHALNCVQRRP